MKSMRIIYHLARADFLERVRRYSFLILLALTFFLVYQTAIGNLSLSLGQYRGVFNSAWVGAMMSLIANFFIGWFGFYIVKGSITRDRETGVGQIMAATPLTRPLYLFGKWLSNFAVLAVMFTVVALASIAIVQFWKGESNHLNLIVLLEPFFFLVWPLIALVAALAVVFETISFLRGGFGNVVYFIAFAMLIPLFLQNENLNKHPAFEPIGIILMSQEMGKAAEAVYPDYDGGFTLGDSGSSQGGTFIWTGVHWTPDVIFARFAIFTLAILLIFFAALFFDRFDPSRSKPWQINAKRAAPDSASVPFNQTQGKPASTSQALSNLNLTPLNKAANRFSFLTLFLAELKLLLKGQRWWWYVVMGGIIIACLINPSATVRESVLPIAWVWPILIWSTIGNREVHNNVQQMTFSSASPLLRQLPAQWLAGFIVTLLVSIGAIIRFTIDGSMVSLLALLSGAIFIPSLALASGVWSGTKKLFEILYMVIWYIGPINNLPSLDYIGSHGNGQPEFFIPFSIALIVFAFIGRTRQIRT
jgi:hypothetical protein